MRNKSETADPIQPRVVVSKCLGFEACRYNGEMLRDDFLQALQPFVQYVFVCPEVEIGLGTPRDPVRLVSLAGDSTGPRLIQPASGRDLTGPMERFSTRFAKALEGIDGFVLKSASPSCAVKDSKHYSSADQGPALGRRPGLFGEAMVKTFPHLAIEDEGRLKNQTLREHFLTRIFTTARFRLIEKKASMASLVRFHSVHKFLLMTYNQSKMRAMGRTVANPAGREIRQVLREYSRLLGQALSRVPRRLSNLNVLMHGLGHVSRHLKSSEKAFFLEILEKYRNQQVPLSSATSVLRSWLIRFDVQYLLQQVYFTPFPEELVSLKDSGKGRKVG